MLEGKLAVVKCESSVAGAWRVCLKWETTVAEKEWVGDGGTRASAQGSVGFQDVCGFQKPEEVLPLFLCEMEDFWVS